MNSFDLVLMGTKNLWRRKTRTILTVLGVIIGAASIIVMISLGLGMERSNRKRLEQFGSITEITVMKPYVWEEEGSRKSDESKVYFDDETVNLFKSYEHVEGVLATKNVQMELRVGKNQLWAQIVAVDMESLRQFGFELDKGEWPKENAKETMLSGATTGNDYYDPTERNYNYEEERESLDLLNERVKCFINGEYSSNGKKKRAFNLNVVGVLKGTGNWEDNKSYITFYAYEQYVKQNNRKYKSDEDKKRVRPGTRVDIYDEIKVKVDDIENVMPIIEELKLLGYEAYGMAEYIESEKKNTATMQAILAGIGGVSLLIAAIGITNTMIMSIYERTREIGVMKVLGAKLKDIKNLFLFEAALIGLIGGIFGIGLSYGVSYIINKFAANMGILGVGVGMGMEQEAVEISYIPVSLVLGALAFSTLIGIISGYYPALKAMKLSALKAISTN